MNECYCDYEIPTVYRATTPTAKKSHQCEECNRTIAPGEVYEYVFSIWDGHQDTFKTCSHCLALRSYVTSHVPCFCWAHGNLHDDARETLGEYAGELPGLVFGGLRFIVQTNRIRQQQRTGARA